MEIKEFINGKKPECPEPPNYRHAWVHDFNTRKIFCLWCGLDKGKVEGVK